MSFTALTGQLIRLQGKLFQLSELPQLRWNATCQRISCTNQRLVDSRVPIAIKRVSTALTMQAGHVCMHTSSVPCMYVPVCHVCMYVLYVTYLRVPGRLTLA